MNPNFKDELAAFLRDLNAVCDEQEGVLSRCFTCPLCGWDDTHFFCKGSFLSKHFDLDATIEATEAYRRRKKPCAEVIDKAKDVYTLEVEVERSGRLGLAYSASAHAMLLMGCVEGFYARDYSDRGSATVRVLSAKRFVLESHRGDEE